MRTKALPLALAATLGLSCTGMPEKHYDDNTGLVGVEVPEGSLAGTWALVIEFRLIVNVAIVGPRNGGSQGLRLLHRTWDAQAKKYHDEFRWCFNDIFEVEGTKSNVDPGTLAFITPLKYDPDVKHDEGKFNSGTILDVWGLRNLPDPMNTPLPTKDNYQDAPQRDWMWDQDEDGNPGITARLEGTLNADVYQVSRSAYTLDGTVLSEDRVQGLSRGIKSEQHSVASSNRFATGESHNEFDPDPKASWFDMVRLEDNATCDDVKRAQEEGRLASRRPF